MQHLPECGLRSTTSEAGIYYCRHSKVHTQNNLVTGGHCGVCLWRTEPCDDPRPIENDGTPHGTPTYAQMLWNLGESLAAFVADSCSTVSREDYQSRLEICDTCEHRDGGNCRLCGCFLKLKAKGRAFECPLNKWPVVQS